MDVSQPDSDPREAPDNAAEHQAPKRQPKHTDPRGSTVVLDEEPLAWEDDPPPADPD